jgi:hypothetical protein
MSAVPRLRTYQQHAIARALTPRTAYAKAFAKRDAARIPSSAPVGVGA